MSCDLTGIGVLVTRPRGQEQQLCDLIASQGGTPIPFPTIAIQGPVDPDRVRAQLQQIQAYDLVIFVSPNAVRYGLELMSGEELPPGLPVAAVGKGTARTLAGRGVQVDIVPRQRFDSEALLQLPELTDVADRRILILRGNGGRALLGDTLRQRGARVEYAEVYSRHPLRTDAGSLLATWQQRVRVCTVTSCEILDSLFQMLGEQGSAMLTRTPLVVVSERIQERARELGCSQVIIAPEASDQGVLHAVCGWMEQEQSGKS
jgi:uroporphyrinogen-III synthase